jgi:hypothetical protein
MLYDPKWDTTTDDTTCILRHAAAYLRRNGWTQGTLRQGSAMCLIGVLAHLTYEDIRCNISQEITDRLNKHLGFNSVTHGIEMLVHWNDHPMRTSDEVIKVLEEA